MDGEKGCRLDVWLVQNDYASGREKAKELLKTGQVLHNGKPALKPAETVLAGDSVVCTAEKPRYVGRGGYKLEKALSVSGITVEGRICMDIGSSTGGFADCLLQNGAAHVTAVDVGHDQLHPSLREDPRVTVAEGTDVRDAALAEIVPPVSLDVITADVSFISLAAILPAAVSYLHPDGDLICLIKPQFEAGPAGIGKNGVVKDPAVHRRVLTRMLTEFVSFGLCLRHLTYSPIAGGEGNIEYLAILTKSAAPGIAVDVSGLVQEAFSQVKRAK